MEKVLLVGLTAVAVVLLIRAYGRQQPALIAVQQPAPDPYQYYYPPYYYGGYYVGPGPRSGNRPHGGGGGGGHHHH